MSQVNVYALLTTLGALVIAGAVLAGSLGYRARQRRTGRLSLLEDAVIGRQIDDLAAGAMAPEEATRMLRELRYLPQPGAAGERPTPLHGALSFPESESGSARLGYRLFKWLLILAFFLLLGLMGYAWWTYPTSADATGLLPPAASLDARLDAVRELRRDWLQQVKDLGQMFVLTPVLPLISAVIGYLFGVRRNDGHPTAAPAPLAAAVPAPPAEVVESSGTGTVLSAPAGTPASRWEERNLATTGRRPATTTTTTTSAPAVRPVPAEPAPARTARAAAQAPATAAPVKAAPAKAAPAKAAKRTAARSRTSLDGTPGAD